MTRFRGPAGVFLILLGSNAFFWHSRDWNVSSRLMLTYSIVDRGQVSINGLEDHTRDRARIGRIYYSDKPPGYSVLAVPVYWLAKTLLRLPAHPLHRRGPEFTHWPSDYWITLGTSGLLTSLTGALLASMARRLGCGPRRSVLVGLSYGLSTPAWVYGTLAYGHPATAFGLLWAFDLVNQASGTRRPAITCGLAGFSASWASIVELSVGPVAALIGGYLLVLVIGRRLPSRTILTFGAAAALPALVLVGYNLLAFGSPLDMGYFHEDLADFRGVHSRANPLGLRGIDWGRAAALLWGEHRGLLFYAPILALAPFGWIVLFARRFWGVAIVSLLAVLAVLMVNLSYPEWTGGFSTGPRLLLPAIPFAMLAVAGSLAVGGRFLTGVAAILAVVGWVIILMFQGYGGRVAPAPDDPRIETPFRYPLRGVVWPTWRGDPLPADREGGRFDRTLASPAVSRWKLRGAWQGLEFAPLVVFQAIGVIALLVMRPGLDAGPPDAYPERGPVSGPTLTG